MFGFHAIRIRKILSLALRPLTILSKKETDEGLWGMVTKANTQVKKTTESSALRFKDTGESFAKETSPSS